MSNAANVSLRLQVEELMIDYSNCGTAPTSLEPIDPSRVTSHFKSSNVTTQPVTWMQSNITVKYGGDANVTTRVCSLEFSIPNAIGPPVFFYYRLTDFYQNHRRYVKSMDTDQLMGKAVSNSSIASGNCDPLQLDSNGFAYYPCGLIANSQFNDTFFPPILLNTQDSAQANVTYDMTNRGIAWDSDRQLYKPTEYTREQVVPPVNWRERYPHGYTAENPLPNLQDDEPFQVWMRTAALPTFSKLALRNDTDAMASGRYRVDIYDCRLWSLRRLNMVWRLTTYRLPCRHLWWHKIYPHIYKDGHGRQESVSWDCLYHCRWRLCDTRRTLHGDAFDQAKV